jgi:D-arabinose 1-dehydrogenase-like Zn-dependent alcohol dehydrogenase
MRAFAVGSFREAPAIRELPIPTADGAFLIRVSYAGVNPIDYKLLERLNADSTYPFVLGIDFAEVVERVPAGERDFQGWGPHFRHGTHARRIRRAHRCHTGRKDRTAGPYRRAPIRLRDDPNLRGILHLRQKLLGYLGLQQPVPILW